jgi:hypothetical protein
MNIKRIRERQTFNIQDLEKLQARHDAAWEKYRASFKVVNEHYQDFITAERDYLNALYYERARRAVMTDLINVAGKLSQEAGQ